MSRSINLKLLALVAVSAALAAFEARAATITVQDSVDDFEAQKRSNGTPLYAASENFGVSRVGHQSNFNNSGSTAPGGITSIFFFQLPALTPGQTITSATFSVGLVPETSTGVQPTFNGDLYALGLVSAVSKTAADAEKYFYVGNTAQSSLPSVAGAATVTGPVQRVADNFIVPADFIAAGGTESSSPKTADMTSYIQNLYADPGGNVFVPGTSFLVVRVNTDADTPPTGTQRYSLAFQGTGPNPPGNGGAGAAAIRPLLTLNTIPEPASLSLVGLALFGYVAMARRDR